MPPARVGHALRFILPNDRIRDGIYVPPGTHSTGPTSGGPATPPYGVRFRLKASFDTSSMSSGAKVLAQALKTYGMFLADGGEIAVTIASDRFSTAKWSGHGITNNQSLTSITVNDFEVVRLQGRVDWKLPRTASVTLRRRTPASVPDSRALDDARAASAAARPVGRRRRSAGELERQHQAEDVTRADRVEPRAGAAGRDALGAVPSGRPARPAGNRRGPAGRI